MRNPDGTLNGDLNDNIPALTSGSVVRYESSSLNENETVYDLLPIVVNKPPIIIASITQTSIPQIKPYSTADPSRENLYLFPDDSVKVNLGSSFTLRLQAEQPNVFNVENGIPKTIPSSTGLIYVWKKDGRVLTTYTIESLRSRMIVDGNSLVFENIQPEHAGSYICEVSNDIGTSVSETINLEIVNLDFDSLFYKNLVSNPYGKEGTDGWESTSSDLIAKPFSKVPSQEFLRPYNVDQFDYTPDMLHPRPYQIDAGVEKGFDMTKDLLKDGAYFTRTRYTFTKKGGSFLVRAYQDIDLTDAEWMIKGGVWGIEGVRGIFSCYIGNGLGPFIPTETFVDPVRRTNPRSYVGSKPRISIENFLNSGPNFGPRESVYVTLEEFDNETRLSSRILQPSEYIQTKPDRSLPDNDKASQDDVQPSTIKLSPSLINESSESIQVKTDRIVLHDPWKKRLTKYRDQQYYTEDIYSIGDLSKRDGRDMVLFTADELMPDPERRYTYGQYAEFNKVILERLNPNTTKIRVTLHFETEDQGVFETWMPTLEASDEPFEFVGHQWPFIRHSFNEAEKDWNSTISARIRNLERNKGKSEREFQPLGPDPRGMITGLNLMLLPILRENTEITDYYTKTTLIQNGTPESIIPSGLYTSRVYDPFGKNTRRLNLQFGFSIPAQPTLENSGTITQDGDLSLAFEVFDPDTQTTLPQPVDSNRLFLFPTNSPIFIEGSSLPLTKRYENNIWVGTTGDPNEINNLDNYFIKKYVGRSLTPSISSADTASLLGAADNLNDYGYIVDYNNKHRVSDPSQDTPSFWNGKARYQLIFANQLTQNPNAPNNVGSRWQTYFLTLDFSNGSNDTKVILSRTDNLFPGYGNVQLFLSHSIDSQGVLHTKIPFSLITKPELDGGLGYVSERYGPNAVGGSSLINVTGSLIACVNGLRKNLRDFIIRDTPNTNAYYNEVLQNILAPLTVDINNFVASNTIPLYYEYEEVFGGFGGFGGTVRRYVSLSDPNNSTFLNNLRNVRPVARFMIDSQIGNATTFYAWVDNSEQYRVTLSEPSASSLAFGPSKIIRVNSQSTYTGSFSYTEMISFRDALVGYAYTNGSFIPGPEYNDINNYYTGSLSIDLSDSVFRNSTSVLGDLFSSAQFAVPPQLQSIVDANLSNVSRPSLLGVKVVTPEFFNDGVGSPSSGADSSGLDYSITYKVIKDSYTKDNYQYGP